MSTKAIISVGLPYSYIAEHLSKESNTTQDDEMILSLIYKKIVEAGTIDVICPNNDLNYNGYIIGCVVDSTANNTHIEYNPYNVYKYRKYIQQFKNVFNMEPKIYLTIGLEHSEGI